MARPAEDEWINGESSDRWLFSSYTSYSTPLPMPRSQVLHPSTLVAQVFFKSGTRTHALKTAICAAIKRGGTSGDQETGCRRWLKLFYIARS